MADGSDKALLNLLKDLATNQGVWAEFCRSESDRDNVLDRYGVTDVGDKKHKSWVKAGDTQEIHGHVMSTPGNSVYAMIYIMIK